MTKVRVSATIDKETEKKIERILRRGSYRNKSHVLEEAIKLLSKEVEK